MRSNGYASVHTDASDIYSRMDLSAYAKTVEVVKTVNGLLPGPDGNVEVTEQEPEVVASPDEFVDTSKKYVLPDGYIYAYRKKFIPGGTTPNFTNQLPIALDPLTMSGPLDGVGYKQNVRYNADWENKVFIEESYTGKNTYSTGIIKVNNGDVVRINAMGIDTGDGAGSPPIQFVTEEFAAGAGFYSANLSSIVAGGGKYTLTGQYENGLLSDVEIHINQETFGWVAQYHNIRYLTLRIRNTTPPNSVIVTVNEEITYTVTEDRYEWSWENTGEPYVKPDYLGMITALEERLAELEKKLA